MIDVQTAAVKNNSAVLTGVSVTFKYIVSREFDLLFGQAVEETKDNYPRHPNLQGDGLKHFWFGIGHRKIPPAYKIVR